MASTFNDTQCSVNVSNYKWLSETLKTAQQQYALVPTIQTKVLDDTLYPSIAYAAPGGENGQVVAAPDGSILRVGKDSSNNLAFWKIPDASQLANWTRPADVIIETSGNWINTLNCSISVSDYIGGTYVIDVVYYKTITGTTNISVKRSTNGGVSFGSADSTPSGGDDTNAYCAAGKPIYQDDGTVSGIFVYVRQVGANQYSIYYRYYNGSSWTSVIQWSEMYANTSEWYLDSLTIFYNPNTRTHWVLFSGLHYYFDFNGSSAGTAKKSLYLTEIQLITGATATDIWSLPQPILVSLSSSAQNIDSFVLPRVAYDGDLLYLVFKGTLTESVKEDGTVTSRTNYFMSWSRDMKNFTYPVPIIFTDGTYFQVNLTYPYAYSLVKQNSQYYYLAGGGDLWQFTKNNVTADLSSDTLNYKIEESAGAPSSIILSIANQNGQWVGSSPTGTGYQAIARNKKILLYQGYLNASGVAEYAPRNTYFIDEIQQTVKAGINNLQLRARDLYKKLRVLTSKFVYNFKGADLYFDTFDGTTLGNWNQLQGSWTQTSNTFQPTAAPTTEAIITLSGLNIRNPEGYISVVVKLPNPSTSNELMVYPWWKSSRNFIRLRITGNANGVDFTWRIEKCIGGSITVSDNGTDTFSYGGSNKYMRIWARNYSYQLFHFVVNSASTLANQLIVNNIPQNVLKNSTSGEVNTSGTGVDNVTTVALGCNGEVTEFANFRMNQYAQSQNLKETVTSLGTIANILDYKTQNALEEYVFYPQNWTQTSGVTYTNRIIRLSTNKKTFNKVTTISDGELEFEGRMNVVSLTSSAVFSIYFRSASNTATDDCYEMQISRIYDPGAPTVPFIKATLRLRTTSFGNYNIYTSGVDPVSGNGTFNSLRFDVTKFHKYKLVFSKGQIIFYVDGQLALAWYDANTTQTFSGGYFAFGTDSNTSADIQNITGSVFYNQISSFILNPGDDFDNAVRSLTNTVRGWNFSDLFGRFKSIILASTDPITYTYQNQLLAQNTSNSDAEYISQVTVLGDGVSAIAKDTTKIGTTMSIRDQYIVDYKITTLAEAQRRADYELVNFNKFDAQVDPKQTMNVGSEVFDVVGINFSLTNTNQTSRLYTQTFAVDGGSREYSVTFGTGKVS